MSYLFEKFLSAQKAKNKAKHEAIKRQIKAANDRAMAAKREAQRKQAENLKKATTSFHQSISTQSGKVKPPKKFNWKPLVIIGSSVVVVVIIIVVVKKLK